MEISLSRFIQLTALIASGGTLVTACTVNNVHEDSDAGVAGSANFGTGGSINNGGASNTTAGANSAGTSNLSAGGTTSTSVAGATSTAGAATTGGASSTAGSSGTGVAGSTSNATGGKTATGGSNAAVGGNTNASGGKSTTGGTATSGGSSSCVSSDPAGESLGFDCTKLSFYAETCDNPTAEGAMPTYGASMCEQLATQRVASVKIFTDCLTTLTKPASGWCGAEHQTAVDACRNQMSAATCPSSAAQTACANIHNFCSTVSVASCVADLSPLGDASIAAVEPCMEGASYVETCGGTYRACAGYPEIYPSVTDTCNQYIQTCSSITLANCSALLDIYQTGYLTGSFARFFLDCTIAARSAGGPCDEVMSGCNGA